MAENDPFRPFAGVHRCPEDRIRAEPFRLAFLAAPPGRPEKRLRPGLYTRVSAAPLCGAFWLLRSSAPCAENVPKMGVEDEQRRCHLKLNRTSIHYSGLPSSKNV